MQHAEVPSRQTLNNNTLLGACGMVVPWLKIEDAQQILEP